MKIDKLMEAFYTELYQLSDNDRDSFFNRNLYTLALLAEIINKRVEIKRLNIPKPNNVNFPVSVTITKPFEDYDIEVPEGGFKFTEAKGHQFVSHYEVATACKLCGLHYTEHEGESVRNIAINGVGTLLPKNLKYRYPGENKHQFIPCINNADICQDCSGHKGNHFEYQNEKK